MKRLPNATRSIISSFIFQARSRASLVSFSPSLNNPTGFNLCSLHLFSLSSTLNLLLITSSVHLKAPANHFFFSSSAPLPRPNIPELFLPDALLLSLHSFLICFTSVYLHFSSYFVKCMRVTPVVSSSCPLSSFFYHILNDQSENGGSFSLGRG